MVGGCSYVSVIVAVPIIHHIIKLRIEIFNWREKNKDENNLICSFDVGKITDRQRKPLYNGNVGSSLVSFNRQYN